MSFHPHHNISVTAVTVFLWDLLLNLDSEWTIVRMHVSQPKADYLKLSRLSVYFVCRCGLGSLLLFITSGRLSNCSRDFLKYADLLTGGSASKPSGFQRDNSEVQ